MGKTPGANIPDLVKQWQDTWFRVQSYRMRDLVPRLSGKRPLDLAEVDAKEKLRTITARLCVQGTNRGIDVSALRTALFRPSRFDSADLVLKELLAAYELENPHDVTPAIAATNTNMGTAVILQGRNSPAIVQGKEKRLNTAQYDVIEALVNRRPHGITKDTLESVRTDGRGILRRLRHDKDWASVIHMAKVTSGRYCID